MKSYIAAIDAGTGGVRCVLYDIKGHAVSQDYRELLTVYTPDGRAEQDPVELVKRAGDAVRGAILRSGIEPAALAGVGVTGTQTTFVPLDGDGHPLTNMILWQDARGTAMFPWIRARLSERGLTEGELYRRTLKPLDALLAGAKLLWLREHEPSLYARIRALANPQALLLRTLGAGEVTLDITDGGWWLCHDGATLEADPELAELFGLDPGLFPAPIAPGTLVGRVTKDAADRTGLAEGTPLFQGAVDQCCAALGAGNDGMPDLGTLCLGTAGVVMAYGDAPVPDPRERYYVIRYPTGGYAHETAVPVAAAALRWVRDMLYQAGSFDPADIYRRMDGEAERSPVGAGGLLFLPHLAGSIYPEADPAIRGGWVGASLSTRRADLIRAALEGICFEMRQVMEAGGSRFKTLRLLGGASRSELWNQLQADVYGLPVETVAAEEATALGAAMIAAAGSGLFESLPEAVRAMSRVKRRYEPDPARSARYDRIYHIWLDSLEDLRKRTFPALAEGR